MDIKKSIEQKVNQTVESLITDFEAGYIGCLIGNEVIKVKVKLDAKISSVEFDTDSKEPVIVDLVRELNSDYEASSKVVVIDNMFYGSKTNPMLQIDDKYFLCMVGMPHQVTRLEYNKSLSPRLEMVHKNQLSDGDWIVTNIYEFDYNNPTISDFALVYRDELYFWNFSQVEHDELSNSIHFKLIFR